MPDLDEYLYLPDGRTENATIGIMEVTNKAGNVVTFCECVSTDENPVPHHKVSPSVLLTHFSHQDEFRPWVSDPTVARKIDITRQETDKNISLTIFLGQQWTSGQSRRDQISQSIDERGAVMLQHWNGTGC
eukprot:3491328-Amphidinium_carterae.1